MLDPLPTWLAKGCSAELILLITNIVNTSMSTGTVPDSFKVAHVTPVLKKTSLDRNCLKNYRPISNLSFVSKVLEKTVLSRLMDYLTQENLLEPYQSAYKSGHSTETALNAVHNFITSKLDEDCFVLLVLLDLSSAFDTVNHSILLERLQSKYRLGGTVLSWFNSYITERYQQVKIEDVLSSPRPLVTGVPQGSVLGPVLFSLYLAELVILFGTMVFISIIMRMILNYFLLSIRICAKCFS
ncbi:putative RNA-directed DNA polymerase from mobile element jockey-like [Apostichopus japonicus]|uniref:Putative RNA-directed DNA polymerase from mobile element jockey-like n=1 Tax=Stichopus japonicus TaxID=307972 RepID=A0A2G8JBY1_STIJA|nr:putative RNA-directed DNA polymerase from mobile element jockey-like [Apostichopus japonicus]